MPMKAAVVTTTLAAVGDALREEYQGCHFPQEVMEQEIHAVDASVAKNCVHTMPHSLQTMAEEATLKFVLHVQSRRRHQNRSRPTEAAVVAFSVTGAEDKTACTMQLPASFETTRWKCRHTKFCYACETAETTFAVTGRKNETRLAVVHVSLEMSASRVEDAEAKAVAATQMYTPEAAATGMREEGLEAAT